MIQFRMATTADLPAILDLLHQLNPDDGVVDMDTLRLTWENIQTIHGLAYVVADCDDRIVATCCLMVVPNLTRECRPFGIVENVVVDKAWRRQGLASQMLEFVKGLARQKRCYKLMLMSGIHREEAHALYVKAGFSGDGKIAFDCRL
jgi:GNAT superfamily N-acetyltransferase